MKRGRVVTSHLCKERQAPMIPVQEVLAISGLGQEGDSHVVKHSRRQVLVMDEETLDALGLPNGSFEENATAQGLDFPSPDFPSFPSIIVEHVFPIGGEVTLEAT